MVTSLFFFTISMHYFGNLKIIIKLFPFWQKLHFTKNQRTSLSITISPFLAPLGDVRAERDTLWLVSAQVFPRVPWPQATRGCAGDPCSPTSLLKSPCPLAVAVCPESGSSIHSRAPQIAQSSAPPRTFSFPWRLPGRPRSVLRSLLTRAAVLNGTDLCQRNSWREEGGRGRKPGWAEGGGGQLRGAGLSGEPACRGWWLAARPAGDDPPLWELGAVPTVWAQTRSTCGPRAAVGSTSAPSKGLRSSRQTTYVQARLAAGYPTTLGHLLTPGVCACCSFHLDALPASCPYSWPDDLLLPFFGGVRC